MKAEVYRHWKYEGPIGVLSISVAADRRSVAREKVWN